MEVVLPPEPQPHYQKRGGGFLPENINTLPGGKFRTEALIGPRVLIDLGATIIFADVIPPPRGGDLAPVEVCARSWWKRRRNQSHTGQEMIFEPCLLALSLPSHPFLTAMCATVKCEKRSYIAKNKVS